MVVLRGGAVSYERGTPMPMYSLTLDTEDVSWLVEWLEYASHRVVVEEFVLTCVAVLMGENALGTQLGGWNPPPHSSAEHDRRPLIAHGSPVHICKTSYKATDHELNRHPCTSSSHTQCF